MTDVGDHENYSSSYWCEVSVRFSSAVSHSTWIGVNYPPYAGGGLGTRTDAKCFLRSKQIPLEGSERCPGSYPNLSNETNIALLKDGLVMLLLIAAIDEITHSL